jgi:hypothetical protein
MIDWQKDCLNAMWSMFMLGRERGDSFADTEALKENVARLIRLATQKTAGQHGNKNSVNWDSLTPTLMNIAICATALCLDGRFGEMPKEIEGG